MGFRLRPIEPFHSLFFEKNDERAHGRRCLLFNGIFANIAANLTSGVFYSGFLIGNDIDITRIGIITFIPYFASLLTIFSPMLLERMEKRRWPLALTRLAYYLINYLGVTLLPMFTSDPDAKVIGFAIIVLVSNAINFLFNPGYSVWHIKFLPEEVRANYFNVYQIVVNAILYTVVLASSAIVDKFTGTPAEMTVLVIFRYIAIGFAILDCFVLSRPVEYPYEHSKKKLKISSFFTVPLKNKKFRKTLGLYYFYAFAVNLPSAVLNTYILSEVGISYSMISLLNMVYFLFFIFFGKFWQHRIRDWGWIKTYGISLLLCAPTYIIYGMVSPANYSWLFIIARLTMHFSGVGLSLTTSNLLYINLPKEDQTTYTSFHTLIANLVTLAGMMVGTLVTGIFGSKITILFGFFPSSSVAWLMIVCGLMLIVNYWMCKRCYRELEPPENLSEEDRKQIAEKERKEKEEST